ncbi:MULTISPECIES: polysaccharide deacetylase family protein [unclassified Sinorhizobium]|uniref:polysaccharide deacetylase family protein n=1 Tax=unclassified Sinorhizobium TaxID=2613772 RepID=UPI00352672A1
MTALWRTRGKRAAISSGLAAISFLASAGIMRDACGCGAIFTLHHVRPKTPRIFAPNAHLEITPEYLDLAIRQLKKIGYDFIPLDAVPERLRGRNRPLFAAFTLDDGNRNNAEHALPVFESHGVPFTVFVTRGFTERTHSMWWETLAELLNRLDAFSFDFGSGPERLDLGSPAQKHAAFDRFAAYILTAGEAQHVAAVDAAARQQAIDPLFITEQLTMTADELRRLAAHPLASLGAHTLSHRALALIGENEAAEEMAASAAFVETITGKRPRTIAYPYGTVSTVSKREARLAKELGFAIGVTTQPGILTADHIAEATYLPRISLNGLYQNRHSVTALASGIPFRLMRKTPA